MHPKKTEVFELRLPKYNALRIKTRLMLFLMMMIRSDSSQRLLEKEN